MAIRYWEYEDAPFKEKLKEPNVKEIAKVYFDNETKAYRFSKALSEVKKKGGIKLRDCGEELPIATWKRYLDFGVMVGILKHEDGIYSFTDRYSKPFRNVSLYIKAWIESQKEDDLSLLFANARIEKQTKRGGRVAAMPSKQQEQQDNQQEKIE
jgi:hypothetical protein